MSSVSVTFLPSGRVLEVPSGSTLMVAVEAAGLALSTSCRDGEFLCGFCILDVAEGAENLSDIDGRESQVIGAMGGGGGQRLACQTRVYGPVSVRASYW